MVDLDGGILSSGSNDTSTAAWKARWTLVQASKQEEGAVA